MSYDREGCLLSLDEIAAIMALSGKQNMIGFQTEEAEGLTREKLWNACCRLMADSMMTQIDGKFRMSRELVDVMRPACQARNVLAVTPASDLYPPMILWAADTVCAMKATPYGKYILIPVSRGETADVLAEEFDLSWWEIDGEKAELPPPICVAADAPREQLLEGCSVLMERLEPNTGIRLDWCRIVGAAAGGWLQWTRNDGLACAPLTRATLSDVLKIFL